MNKRTNWIVGISDGKAHEYKIGILCAGDSHERAEVIQQQMADEKLDRLRRRLEKIHKEELEDGYDTADVA